MSISFVVAAASSVTAVAVLVPVDVLDDEGVEEGAVPVSWSVAVVEFDVPPVVVAFIAVLTVESALSSTVEVSDLVTDTGGAVVTLIPSGGCSVPSTSSGLKMVMSLLQLDASWLSWQNTAPKRR